MKNKGFTLIEIIIVITILSLVIAALGGIFESGMKYWDRVNNQTELQDNLRFALYNIVEDIKSCHGISEIGSSYIKLIDPDDEDKVIYYYLDSDPYSSEHKYNLSGQTLYRQNGATSAPVAIFVQTLEFQEFPTGADAEDISFVKIVIKGNYAEGKELILQSGAEIKWKSLGL